MLDHVGVHVSDFAAARAFYSAALAPLGIALLVEVSAEQTGSGSHAGFGADDKPFFWIGEGPARQGGLLDVDGNNIEAVCHAQA